MALRGIRAIGLGALAGAGAAFMFDPTEGRRRRAMARDRATGTVRRTRHKAGHTVHGAVARAQGLVQRVRHLREEPKPPPNDADLAAKVMTVIFRPPDVPKGTINVNAEFGVIVLRGEVPNEEMRSRLQRSAEHVHGVRAVENLLHLPGEPAPDDPRLPLSHDRPVTDLAQ
jgi:osmotically-inducible protein OsmY